MNDGDSVGFLTVVQQFGLPIAMLLCATVILWKFIGVIITKLFETYTARIDAVCAERDRLREQVEADHSARLTQALADRDHLQARCEQAEDRVRELAREMVEEIRSRRTARSKSRTERRPTPIALPQPAPAVVAGAAR